MSNPKGIPPNEHVRQQIFHMLQRISSYTAWDRILGYYKKWVEVTETSLRMASDSGAEKKSSLKNSHYIKILQGFAAFEEGVHLLGKGDKRIFQFNAHGKFALGLRPFCHWQQLLRYIASGDNDIDEVNTPLWQEFVMVFNEFGDALSECSPDINEREWLDTPSQTFYNEWLENALSKMTFPDPLPPVPDPRPHRLVASGRTIPFSGIWEPVDAPAPSPWSLFKKTQAPSGPLPIDGTMAYLHGGSAAPNRYDTLTPRRKGTPVTWRLLWKDDRYLDGRIPEEEKDYVFYLPAATPAAPAAPQATNPSGTDLLVLTSGQIAPVASRWLLEGDLHVSITMDKGAVLPLHEGRSVRWVQAAA